MASPRLILNSECSMVVPVISIIDSHGPHTVALKDNLRPEDVNEIIRFGVTVKHALWYSYKNSLIRKTALIDGKVAAMWGCTGTFLGKVGIPWLLTAPEVRNISPLKFTRIYQQEVVKMLRMFQRLENYVDAEYASAVRLLEIIGFTVEEPQKIGLGFYRKFWIER